VILVGDHLPELSVETILRDVSLQEVACPCLILRAEVQEEDNERFLRLGVAGVVPKGDASRVLQGVQDHWPSKTSDRRSTRAGLENASRRAAA
jgi:hypothetical protein